MDSLIFWLPERDSQRTNSRVVTDVLPYHYRWQNKTKTLFRGEKPDFIPKSNIVSQKEMRHYQYVQAYENPIEKALEFTRIMKEEGLNQNQLAQKLGISSVRVCQLLNLLKLPEDQQKYILEYGKEKMITERQLRKEEFPSKSLTPYQNKFS
ncbi:MAG: hypothetical protein KJ915_09280 [Candidatus Omnitrophica bacterium]|nr:hypothetical protein [Candidatus Omnitrophota bacterium]